MHLIIINLLFKIFLYFLYIMNLSIYIVVAYYVSKGNLAQVVSGWTPNQKVWGSNPLSSKKMEHCSGFDPRWPHDISREIVDFSREIPKISPDRYFMVKYRVETLRYTIFSSMIKRRFSSRLYIGSLVLILSQGANH